MSKLSSFSLAKKTWSSYATAERLLRECCYQKDIPLILPLSPDTITRFILWLAFDRKVSHASINVYLSGIRQLHIQHQVTCPDLRNDFIKMLIQGKKNLEYSNNTSSGDKRKPITPELLTRLKSAITQREFTICDKRMIWSACTILFFGAFRSSEILTPDSHKFDPRFSLCAEDIKLVNNSNSRSLALTVKTPKEDRTGKNLTITVHKANSVDICPVVAWEKWRVHNPPQDLGQPAFRWQSGLPFTCRQLNTLLKELLGADSEGYSSHSFRIGAASTMGSLGFSDSDIKSVGRWHSNAFNSYVRLGKSRRQKNCGKIQQQCLRRQLVSMTGY